IWVNDGPQGRDNFFSNVVIKNALVGIQCETWPGYPDAVTSEARVVIDNVKIQNCSAAGILSRNFRIDATDLLVGDCGQYGVALTGGGAYRFDHTTVANYWGFGVRNTPAFYINNTYPDINNTLQVRGTDTSLFTNSIITGTNKNEFQHEFNSLSTPTAADLRFDHIIIRTDQSTSGDYFPDQSVIYRNQDPGFVDASAGDFHLKETSLAKEKATAPVLVPALLDLDGKDRIFPYDLGCYEYVP
ncbi:MAG TPA: hypothetical protein PK760_01180, partial [Flavobacteriales bacterium]|nr:hypothetical protein [Flavobacteriales bacterium]